MTLPTPAPIRCSTLRIEDAWIDYNGHLNTGYYNVIFDRVLDEAFAGAGLGPQYIKERQLSWMTLESHVCYLREVVQSDPVRVDVRILDLDHKRLQTYSELVHATDGWVAASSEAMHIHVDMRVRKSSPWPADVLEKLDALFAAHRRLPPPERAGRSIGIPRKT